MPERNVTFEIREHLGVITRFESGWNRELNIISWNGGPAKYDLRDWDEYHERMRKGLTLFEDEMRKLVGLYLSYNNQKAVEKGRAAVAQRRSRYQEQMEQKKQENILTRTEEEAYAETQPPKESVEEAEDEFSLTEDRGETDFSLREQELQQSEF